LVVVNIFPDLLIKGFPILPNADVDEVTAIEQPMAEEQVVNTKRELIGWERGTQELTSEVGFVIDERLRGPIIKERLLRIGCGFNTPVN
jgi:hypothetical protein